MAKKRAAKVPTAATRKRELAELAKLMREVKSDEKFQPLFDALEEQEQRSAEALLSLLMLKGGEAKELGYESPDVVLVRAKVLAEKIAMYREFRIYPDRVIKADNRIKQETGLTNPPREG